MKNIDKKRLKILNDTVNHYGKNPIKLRSFIGQGDSKTCLHMHPCGRGGCAFGRLLPAKLRKQIDKEYPNGGCIDDVFQDEDYIIPEDIQNLGLKFLRDLQELHDEDEYWNDKGLTELGKEKVSDIKNNIKDRHYNY